MFFCLLSSCLCIKYQICFYDNNEKCPKDSNDTFQKNQFNLFSKKSYPNATEVVFYILTDLSNNVFDLNKFSSASIYFQGKDQKYSIALDDSVSSCQKTLYFSQIILKTPDSLIYNDIHIDNSSILNVQTGNPISQLISSKSLISDAFSLINVNLINSPKIELNLKEFISISRQNITVVGNEYLKINEMVNDTLLSFFGDSIVLQQPNMSIYIHTQNFTGEISISQKKNISASIQYLMASMSLTDKIISYKMEQDSTLTFLECIWPSYDRVKLFLDVSKRNTIILSSTNIPLFIKNSDQDLKIVTTSSSVFIPALNLTQNNQVDITSVQPTTFSIGTMFCESKNSTIWISQNVLLKTQILGNDGNSFFGLGDGEWSLYQFPPTVMFLTFKKLNTLIGRNTFVVPFSFSLFNGKSSLTVESLIGQLTIYPQIDRLYSNEEIEKNQNKTFILYSSIKSIENVSVSFNKRGLRGFTEGTNIYTSSVETVGSLNEIVIRQTRSIYQVNDKFCIASDSSYCPSDATVYDDQWTEMADPEIAEITFYVYNTTDKVLDFSKFDNLVVNFIGYNNSTVSILADSLEYHISYLVSKYITFDVIFEEEYGISLGYSADLSNTHFLCDFEYIDTDTYNFISDYESFPTSTEEISYITSQNAIFNDFPINKIILEQSIIQLELDNESILLPYDPTINTRYKFIFTEKTKNREIQIIKGATDSIDYSIEISAIPGSAKFTLMNFESMNHVYPIVKLITFGSEITINDSNPPISFSDLISGAIIRLGRDSTNFSYDFDTSANISLISFDPNKKVKATFENVLLPSTLIWSTNNVDVIVRNSQAIGGPSTFTKISLDGELVFQNSPHLIAEELTTFNPTTLVIPYSFTSMPKITFSSDNQVDIASLVMKYVPPINETAFVYLNKDIFEDALFDIICGNFDCENVILIYQSEFEQFNGNATAFVKKCVSDSNNKQCLRLCYDTEPDSDDDDGNDNENHDKNKSKLMYILIGLGCFGVIIIVIILFIAFRHKKKKEELSLRINLLSETTDGQ